MDRHNSRSTTRKLAGYLILGFLAIGYQGLTLRAETLFPPFNDPPIEREIDGKVIWTDLFTADVKAATKFYTEVFGWTSELIKIREVEYVLMRNFDRPVAGLVYRPRVRGENAEGIWVGYLSSSGISTAIAMSKSQGGRVLVEPGVLDGRGGHAIIADPEGSIIGILRSMSGDPEDFQPVPGDFAWSNLLTHQESEAVKFYQSVFRYDPVKADTTDKLNQVYLSSDGYARVGVATLPEGDDSTPGWVHFIRVRNLEETIERATAAGGSVLVPITDDLFEGRLAVLVDPVGATVGLIEWAKSEEAEK